ncbi:MAG: 1-acyl-sn-glycerol-3-phosphate acyltransferase [Chloroflexi bacterium]|jgi:1-acyl-sn-glycerol-3-phosphate acyltransferase|nr:1-acyl-sn-glycerol-3-phosphate acyltransferase [Chloroflexota bacterium]
MESEYRVSQWNRIARNFLRAVGKGLYRSFAQLKITGLEHIPDQGPYLIAINHTTVFEPPLLLTFWPIPPEPLGAVEVWKEPEKMLLAYLYGGIPIDRDRYDRNALHRVLSALRGGLAVMIAPEGRLTFKPGMRRAKLGIAYLLDHYNVPVVPVGIVGCGQDFLTQALRLRRPRVEMHIGRPFRLPPIDGRGERKKDALQRNADLVLAHVAAVLPPEYRGFYSDYQRYLINAGTSFETDTVV